MEETHLYRKIAEEIRQEILRGQLSPGDRLPSVRQMAARWGCTVGTVQRAYQELAMLGLLVSHAGQGTHVVNSARQVGDSALRWAGLVHRSEAFLLEVLTAGYSPQEIDAAMRQAMERWQVVVQQSVPVQAHTLRFAGSHDPVLAWLGAHFPEIVPAFNLQLGFTGSLGGLIALAEGKADLAGCHLWDAEGDSYNAPFVRRLLPGRQIALVTLAHRRLGLMVPPGNPGALHNVEDLARPGLRFVNRQAGSGTRVWLDAALHRLNIDTSHIQGYADERMTHSEVAAAVAAGQADVGFGLQAVALTYGLDFLFLLQERYDLVIPAESLEQTSVARLVSWLAGEEAKGVISGFGGYETGETGMLRWIG
jgi:molybdate-binding protein/DNA-binding transcriptional regulator YhcF (GntR family)